MEPLMSSTQICAAGSPGQNMRGSGGVVHSGSQNVDLSASSLPPVHEILGAPLPVQQTSMHTQVSDSRLNSSGNFQAPLPVPQVKYLSGFSNHMTESHPFVDTASNDSFLSKQLDGEIAEMIN